MLCRSELVQENNEKDDFDQTPMENFVQDQRELSDARTRRGGTPISPSPLNLKPIKY